MPLRNTIVDVRVANEAFLFQELQRAVHGGHVYLGEARMDALENVIHGNMAGNGFERVKDDLALEREAVTPFPEGRAQLAHGTAPTLEGCTL